MGFPKPAADGLARSLPLTRPSRASGFAQIPFATSQAAQVPLWRDALSRKASDCGIGREAARTPTNRDALPCGGGTVRKLR